MPMTVNTNTFSLNAQRQLMSTENGLQTSMQRLSSGLRINSAKDDAAGLQIANRLQSQTSGLSVAIRNGSDGISLAQIAEGALNESTAILQRMRDLALQASNGSNEAAERSALNQEVTALKSELDRISQTTSFGGVKLLDGSFTSKSFQVGAYVTSDDKITFSIASSAANTLGTGTGVTSGTKIATTPHMTAAINVSTKGGKPVLAAIAADLNKASINSIAMTP
ncbi:MAG: flagellin, partial [Endozoicomonas sp.]